jgi:hypothetical protein
MYKIWNVECSVGTSLTGAAYFLGEGWHSTKIYFNHFNVYAVNFQYIKIPFYMYTTIIQRIVYVLLLDFLHHA